MTVFGARDATFQMFAHEAVKAALAANDKTIEVVLAAQTLFVENFV
ncbi:hypothetical protein [Francisella tularensis]